MSAFLVWCVLAADPKVETTKPMLYPIRENGRWGFIDNTGTVVVPLKFLHVERFSEGLSRVRLEDKAGHPTEGFIDASGRFVIGPGPPPNYELPDDYYLAPLWSYRDFHEGRAGFWIGDITGKGGYIDKTGRLVIPVKYQSISDFSEGLACVSLPTAGGMPIGPLPTGFIDANGRFVIQPVEDFIASGFLNGRCIVSYPDKDGSKWGVIDRKGNKVVPPRFATAWRFSDGLSCVRLDTAGKGKYGYIDMDGAIRIPIQFDYACTFVDGRAYVAKRDRAMLIDTAGRISANLDLDPRIFSVGDFSEGLADVLANTNGARRWGFINRNGEFVIPLEYDHVEPFRGGLARVVKDRITGYINQQDEFVWKTTAWGPW
jgi:hypothetical protein